MMFKILAVGLLLPLAAGMKSHGAPHLTLSAVGAKVAADAPHLSMSVVGAAVDTDAPHISMSVVGSTVAEMEKSFARSEEVHQKSMDEISKHLTPSQAVETIEHSEFSNNTALKQITSLITGTNKLRKVDGFGGLDGARRLLNDMIQEAASKYDAEIAKCTGYYANQCALMEVCRGQISAANFVAATSRGLILDAQSIINMNEVRIPETKKELNDHNTQCKASLKALNKQLKIVMGDIAVMTMILKMSDCDAKLIQAQQLSIVRCEECSTNKQFVEFDHDNLQKEVEQLKSPATQNLMSATFSELFNEDDTEISLIMDSQEGPKGKVKKLLKKEPEPKVTKFNNPPLPMTKVPGNPCTDPNGGAPSLANKRAAKCTLKKSPQCYKLQQRFLIIQAGIEDIRDELMEQIAAKEKDCKEMKASLESSIENDKAALGSAQTKLAEGTQKEASAGETGRQVAKENAGYNADLLKQMKICTTNYINFETELCALKKIRGDVFKKMKAGHKGFFQDCQVSPWTPEACTKKCAGGEQKLIRSVLLHPDGEKGSGVGAKCLPLNAKKRCNLGPCPINCKLATWSGWSKCSAKCGGGVSSRVRDVKVPMRYDGKPCGDTTQTKLCAVASCEKDCVLHKFTKWTKCSKDCDGGSKKRMRNIKEPSQGAGECAGEWDKDRLQYQACNKKGCKAPKGQVMKCNQSLDIVLVMDGTPKSGKKGWASEVKAANQLIDAWTGDGITGKPNVAVVHYTGPRTWTGVSKCTSKSKKKVNMVKTCKILLAQHFSTDMKKVKGVINGLQYAPGSKLLSLALMTVSSELALGRKSARTVVIVFVDGAPLSFRKTRIVSETIRKKVRLMYVPVIKFSPLADFKLWASRRWQENIVSVKDDTELADVATGTHIIANICPKEFPKLKNKK